MVSFSGMDHQKSKYSLISEPFLLEAVEASQCYFLKKLVGETQMPKPQEYTDYLHFDIKVGLHIRNSKSTSAQCVFPDIP